MLDGLSQIRAGVAGRPKRPKNGDPCMGWSNAGKMSLVADRWPHLLNKGETGGVCPRLHGAPAKADCPPVETVHDKDLGTHNWPTG